MSGGAKFHVYDPAFGGENITGVYETLAEAIDAANYNIRKVWTPHAFDEWSLDIEDVAVFQAAADCESPSEDGELVARAKAINVQYRPKDTTEDGWSDSLGDFWTYGSADSVCDYRVEPLAKAGAL